jgi:hypothetical protein
MTSWKGRIEALRPTDWADTASEGVGQSSMPTFVPGLGTMLLVAGLLTSCQSQRSGTAAPQQTIPSKQPAVKVAPPTPLDQKKAELGGETWDPAWDGPLERELPPVMLSWRVPRDVRRFCPDFYRMTDVNKRAFWAYFFQAMAAAEAGLNPTTNVRHTEPAIVKVDTVTHQLIHSEGLLQLTYEDEKRYGCNFDWEIDKHLPPHDPRRTILNPQRNLDCGVKILANQLFVLHEPLFAHNSYWSTLQPGTVSFAVFEKQMTNPPAACALPARAHRHRPKGVVTETAAKE